MVIAVPDESESPTSPSSICSPLEWHGIGGEGDDHDG